MSSCLYSRIGDAGIGVSAFSRHPRALVSYMSSSAVNTLRTGDADLRFYITTVQDG